MDVLIPAAFFIASAAAAAIGTGMVRRIVSVLDMPNERSSHDAPTPQSGGLAVVPVILAAWLITPFWTETALDQTMIWPIAGAAVLAILSWIDDMRGLAPALRLVVHLAVAALVVVFALPSGLVFQGLLPEWLDRLAALILWVYFTNAFNFMDGIDGISGIEALGIGLGIAFVSVISGSGGGIAVQAAAIAGAGAGFLWWNWHPARIFLGDVGSVPLGFVAGWLLLILAINGEWAAAIILPMYYLADSGITLARRTLRREKIWQAHREHFYQLAIIQGRSHAEVSRIIGFCNLGLIAFALVSLISPWVGIVLGAFVTFFTLLALKRRSTSQ
jgi:UDP-N-acetylmuramyl pentapeptide phosphotransferase/UDP-N-acetylglucosamine-1-phosphate transferase